MSLWNILWRLGLVEDPDWTELAVVGRDGEPVEYWFADRVGTNR